MEENQKYQQNKYKITAKVVDRDEGLKEYDNIRMIRVVSRDYNLLIMEDYMPIIGRVGRSVELITEDETIKFSPVQGFFMHKKNEFYLLIENYELDSVDAKPMDDENVDSEDEAASEKED
ncbi:MAG: hypothetical protein K6B67_09405 [Lachnospiraceae bacterium]|nr:hypothetical protein [Lachnospiraceae bacterium]